MRIMIALLLAIIAVTVSPNLEARKSQPLNEEERKVAEVFEAEGYSADQIFQGIRMWIAESFESADAVIEYENREEGIVIGNGTMAYPCEGGFTCRIRASSWKVKFTMRAEARDGRFRLTFSNVMLAYPTYRNMGVSMAAYDEPVKDRTDMENIREKLLELGPSIASSLQASASSEDW